MGDRLLDLPKSGQSDSKVVVGIREAGLDFHRPAVMGDRLVDLSAGGQGLAEVVVGIRVVGLDFQGLGYWAIASSTCPRAAKATPRL